MDPAIFLLLTTTGLQLRSASPVPANSRVSCQPGFVPSQSEVTYPGPVCEPCEESGVAYPGNNLHLTPHYDVASVQHCRALCREEKNCRYFTFDTENNWCYLKSEKNPRAVSEDAGQSGARKYISGSGSPHCQSHLENEISEQEVPVQPVQPAPARSSPILSVYDEQGDRTVLAALPATFGATIERESQISGELVASQTSLCSRHGTEVQPPLSPTKVPRLALVFRGGCKFATKAENAGRAGWGGLVILDNQNNTRVDKISGTRSAITDTIPVIFLLKTEADILLRLMSGYEARNVSITDSANFFTEDSTTSIATTTTTAKTTTTTTATSTENSSVGLPRFPSRYDPREEDFRRDFLSKFGSDMVWKKHPFSEGLYLHTRGQRRPSPPSPSPSARPARVATVSQDYSQESDRVIIQSSPLTLGSITVGVILGILLIISLLTLIVGRVRRKARRRAQHTRCQLAIRQFDARNNSLARDNGGFTEDQASPANLPPVRALPRSTYSLLECPVCLEIAWPPKKIYQCREGHIVCDTCKANPNLKTCPMCRISFSNNLTSRNRSLEELARTLREEETVSYLEDSTSTASIVTTRAIPSAPPGPPPPDIVSSSSGETDSEETETAPDTRQLIGDSNPEGVRRLSLSTEVAVVNLVVNLPPE